MDIFLPKKLYGIIGWTLGQTLSPLIHNTGFQILGIPAVYMAWPLQAENLEKFVQCMRFLNIQGCSVTIPHKIAILPFIDNITESASLAGAVNTLFWKDGALCADNTDVSGFMAPIKDLPLDKMDILLLGAGGAAHAAAAGLRLNGAHARVSSPGNRRQFTLAERFGFVPVNWEDRYERPAELVINATPLGMKGDLVNKSPYDFNLAPAKGRAFAYDLVYNPLKTRFLEEAEQHGRECISGLAMFMGQGNEQFRIWTGRNLPQEAEKALVKNLEKGE